MATQQAEDGGEPSASVNPANMHFFRPNDGIYVSEGPEQRTICVSPHLPAAMQRSGDWHVEQFELHKELYRGKTSLLYMATDRISGMQVALKLYRKRKLSVLNRYQVEREVRLHINLHHENIIHLFAAFEDEKHVYMVQEFAVCGDLFEDLKKGGGQLKEKYAVRDVIVPFLSALAYLHNQGIIHRDIKPENILLGANKVIKVADFGLSININHERPVTRAGTLDYMAPEVLVCPDKRRPEENKDKVLLGYTAQVDSWAVGILAYELLVGYPPFEQESRAATYEHIMYKEPKFPSWMSEDAKKFICLALCKNASQRPTINDLMQHSWVSPYMMRHMMPAAAISSPAPGRSRLRNSVSHTSDGPAAGGGGGGAEAGSMASSASGMSPAPPAAASASGSGMMPQGGMGPGVGGRMFMPVASAGAAAATAAAAAAASSSSAVAGGGGGSHPHPHGYPHPAQPHPHPATAAAENGTAGVRHNAASAAQVRSGPVPPQAASPSLKTSTSLQAHPTHGSPHDHITGLGGPGGGEGGRLHDSISDPTARSFELMNPHPPGAAAAASLHAGGASRSGGGAEGLDRSGSHSMVSTASSGMHPARSSQALTSGPSATSSLSFSSRLVANQQHHHHLHHTSHGSGPGPGQGQGQAVAAYCTSPASTRVPPPPLFLPGDPAGVCGMESLGSTDLSAGGSGGCGGGGDFIHVLSPVSPIHPSHRAASLLAPGRPMSQGAGGVSSGGAAAGSPGPASAPPRHRMASPVVPPVNISGALAAAVSAGGSGGGSGGVRLPAPPISPKPLVSELSGTFHRPASGVLSDDSFLPPARTPSMSLGSQMLSPLQAQLMAPRPSSRLNSPSHSRRNSVSQAGMQAASGCTGVPHSSQSLQHPAQSPQLQQHYSLHASTPLPQLSSDLSDPMVASCEDPGLRSSNCFRTTPGGGGGAKLFGKLWGRDPALQSGSGGGAYSNESMGVDGPGGGTSSSFTCRSGGGAGAGGGGGPSSPVVRSGGGGASSARLRMMTPPTEDTRPLMRESSITSSFKSSAGSLRDDLAQQSLTIYHRPGKVPGVGRAALAAREAEAAEAAGAGRLGPHHHSVAAGGNLAKTKSLVVNRNLNGALAEESSSSPLARLGSEAALARAAAGVNAAAAAAAAAVGVSGPHGVSTQRSFTTANSSFARKLANGAIATKVTEYVKGRLPHDEDMAD